MTHSCKQNSIRREQNIGKTWIAIIFLLLLLFRYFGIVTWILLFWVNLGSFSCRLETESFSVLFSLIYLINDCSPALSTTFETKMIFLFWTQFQQSHPGPGFGRIPSNNARLFGSSKLFGNVIRRAEIGFGRIRTFTIPKIFLNELIFTKDTFKA